MKGITYRDDELGINNSVVLSPGRMGLSWPSHLILVSKTGIGMGAGLQNPPMQERRKTKERKEDKKKNKKESKKRRRKRKKIRERMKGRIREKKEGRGKKI